MRIDVITAFPVIFESPLQTALLGKAVAGGPLEVRIHDLRTWSSDAHRTVDDEPFGGGPGMVLKPEPIFAAVESLDPDRGRVLLMSPAGRTLHQAFVRELSAEPHLTLVCGRYEGVDERVVEGLPAEEVSIGDYVLSGGELAALVVIEAVTRLVPGVIGREESHARDSFSQPRMLDHPQYTRPQEFRGLRVPPVLLSGNHAEIERWRRDAAVAKTRRNRPDLHGPGEGQD
ncbi:MAG TPA: tRNA (guanosine(37)-N1)-methyltransferase TrmD [Actinomycetota bacterium]|nr:tRNA (guanosine(37)-N1)-methyltransferase TrmD [Actinomycetota bacterium]